VFKPVVARDGLTAKFLWRFNMHKTSLSAHCARAAALAVAIAGVSLSANAQYAQTNLVSNIPGLATIHRSSTGESMGHIT
jgi:hypothetical protein